MIFKGKEKHWPQRVYIKILFSIAALALQSCALLDNGSRGTEPEIAANAPTTDVAVNSSGVAEIPVIAGTTSIEQQAIIEAINRAGQPLEYAGFEEEVPTSVDAEASDIVELNYEQADLRLVLEELA